MTSSRNNGNKNIKLFLFFLQLAFYLFILIDCLCCFMVFYFYCISFRYILASVCTTKWFRKATNLVIIYFLNHWKLEIGGLANLCTKPLLFSICHIKVLILKLSYKWDCYCFIDLFCLGTKILVLRLIFFHNSDESTIQRKPLVPMILKVPAYQQ